MKIIKIPTKLTSEEKETALNYDYIDKKWTMHSTISTHYNKDLKQGCKPITKYEYEDGTIAGYYLEAPGYSITIRSVEQRQMTEKQMQNLKGKDN